VCFPFTDKCEQLRDSVTVLTFSYFDLRQDYQSYQSVSTNLRKTRCQTRRRRQPGYLQLFANSLSADPWDSD